ncbi:18411_t:CDS:2 [Gigaspora margarita]|uniref:18411_t:CDS:1 n=1 Tax=Gigaspora margarita TaxID=4874 RepID=A0ABN7V6P5_GIGMA|nr:18411_t:CDS:2 [Gigaspora margarita]
MLLVPDFKEYGVLTDLVKENVIKLQLGCKVLNPIAAKSFTAKRD